MHFSFCGCLFLFCSGARFYSFKNVEWVFLRECVDTENVSLQVPAFRQTNTDIKNSTIMQSGMGRQVISKANYIFNMKCILHIYVILYFCMVDVISLHPLKSLLYRQSWYLVQGQVTHSCHPAAVPALYKAKSHHAHLYDYTTPPPSADAFMWHVPSEPLMP